MPALLLVPNGNHYTVIENNKITLRRNINSAFFDEMGTLIFIATYPRFKGPKEGILNGQIPVAFDVFLCSFGIVWIIVRSLVHTFSHM